MEEVMADTNIRILVVDDSPTIRELTKIFLKDLEFTNVEEAADGSNALEKLKSEVFDLVITDWNMPKLSGLDLLKAIRADDKMKKIPVLMVTSVAEKENVIQAAQAGINDYMLKPISAEVLKSKIDKIFGSEVA